MSEHRELIEDSVERTAEQISSDNRNGSLREIQSRANYISHVRSNPTKNITEAIDYLYEAIGSLSAYVTQGVNDEDIEFVQKVYGKLLNKSVINPESQRMFELMLSNVAKRRDEGDIPSGYGICFAISPDNLQLLVVDIPLKSN